MKEKLREVFEDKMFSNEKLDKFLDKLEFNTMHERDFEEYINFLGEKFRGTYIIYSTALRVKENRYRVSRLLDVLFGGVSNFKSEFDWRYNRVYLEDISGIFKNIPNLSEKDIVDLTKLYFNAFSGKLGEYVDYRCERWSREEWMAYWQERADKLVEFVKFSKSKENMNMLLEKLFEVIGKGSYDPDHIIIYENVLFKIATEVPDAPIELIANNMNRGGIAKFIKIVPNPPIEVLYERICKFSREGYNMFESYETIISFLLQKMEVEKNVPEVEEKNKPRYRVPIKVRVRKVSTKPILQ